MYLVEGTPNQSHQSKIEYLREPSDPKIFFVNIIIWHLDIKTSPKNPVTTIGFITHCHTTETTTLYPAYPVYQLLQQRFQPAITDHQIIAENTTVDTPLLA